MKLIVGLGNPGKEYQNTRHNVGFMFLDFYINKKNVSDSWSNKFDGLFLTTTLNGEKVFFLKPSTFMNLSGNSVKKVIDYYKLNINDILVISDDLDLKLGNYKLRLNGSCGGHNGLRSIEKCLSSSDYKRLKIGISNDKNIDTKDYVLGSFNSLEINTLNNLFNDLSFVLDDYFCLTFSELMNKYNHKNR